MMSEKAALPPGHSRPLIELINFNLVRDNKINTEID